MPPNIKGAAQTMQLHREQVYSWAIPERLSPVAECGHVEHITNILD
jgi:hypothetical protein